MVVNKDFLMGFLSGTVAGAVGYRVYEQHNGQLKNLIQQAPPFGLGQEKVEPSVEDLVLQKERLEDLIAEKKSGLS
ncbi:MAG: hypothetical protein ACI4XL_04765 [Bacillus sp. (in: firmicutes)]